MRQPAGLGVAREDYHPKKHVFLNRNQHCVLLHCVPLCSCCWPGSVLRSAQSLLHGQETAGVLQLGNETCRNRKCCLGTQPGSLYFLSIKKTFIF